MRIRSACEAAGEYLAGLLGNSEQGGSPGDAPLDVRLSATDSESELRLEIDDWTGPMVSVVEAPARALAFINRWLCFTPGLLTVVHSGVAARRGEVMLLVGESGAGKSTLVAGLTRRGWLYLSDEAGGIDAHGNVHPYVRPIVLRPGSWSQFRDLVGRLPPGHERFATNEWHVPAVLLGAVADAPMPAGAVVFVRHQTETATELREIGRGEALERMIRQACNLDSSGQDGMDRLARVVRSSDCYQLDFADLDDALDTLETVF